MLYIEHDKLTIIALEEETDSLSYEQIGAALRERPANVIYCELDERIHGVITMGDVYRAAGSTVNLNKNFTYVKPGEYMKARQIFKERARINAVPVIDENERLSGHYIRWDDLLILKYLNPFEGDRCKAFWQDNNEVILVKPCNIFLEKQRFFQKWKSGLESMGVQVEIVDGRELPQHVGNDKPILFTDEDEKRGHIELLQSILGKHAIPNERASYREIANRIDDVTLINAVADAMKDTGVHMLALQIQNNGSEYYQKLVDKEIPKKFLYAHTRVSNVLPAAAMKDFFEELYTEEYARDVTAFPADIERINGVYQLKDWSAPYQNIKNGERLTVGQPEEYDRTIYFFGPCFVVGSRVEDKHTIESFLQAQCNKAGNKCRVVNLGCWNSIEGTMQRMLSTPIHQDDIIVIYLDNIEITHTDNLNLTDSLEQNRAPARWFVDDLCHCNYKVNQIYADAIYEELKPQLESTHGFQGHTFINPGDNIVLQTYIERYFYYFDPKAYDTIGSIVMNCNPFTYGHRYLIEEALKAVDFLIIFVVEEDQSIFTFEERFSLVNAGVADLRNVMVVPSGQLILSQRTFPEYFIKVEDENLVQNVEYDITLFAEQIAPRLNITYRFVGEEPQDRVTNEYNQAMKRILPGRGINVVEIPRKENESGVISASRVRKCLDENNLAELAKLVPRSTMNILGIQWNQDVAEEHTCQK